MVTQKKETLDLSVEDMANTIAHELTTGCKDAPHIKCGFIGEIGCSFPLNGELFDGSSYIISLYSTSLLI